MRRWLAVAMVTTLGGVVPVSACAEEEIVLARLPPAKDAGPSIKAERCVDDTDCAEKTFCERKDCRDVAGTCASRNVVCEEEPSAVCGCDGITYWNDCLRRATGVTAMSPGECEIPVAQLCGLKPVPTPYPGPSPGDGCPAGFFCARLLSPAQAGPNMCPPDVAGTCWALPAVCSSRSGPDRWTHCGSPVPKCTTTCDAIRSGEPHRREIACQ